MTDVSNIAVFRTRWFANCLCAFLCVLILGLAGFTYPKPAVVPYRWQFEFTPGPLRLYIDRDSQDAFWYFTYQVVNRTGRDRIWAPEFTLFTDDGAIVRSGEDVPPKTIMWMEPDATISMNPPGGGGYGAPSERDPARVAEDVRLGYVSVASARDRYRVVVSEDGTLDEKATSELRAA